jgi:hypothetical protein
VSGLGVEEGDIIYNVPRVGNMEVKKERRIPESNVLDRVAGGM